MSFKRKVYNKFFSSEWAIAWRFKSSNHYMENLDVPFSLIPNTKKYWFADPMLCEFNNCYYIFAEGFDKREQKGIIGYFKLHDDIVSDFKPVLIRPYHLSYPCVFEYCGIYYLIPETKSNNSLEFYIAEEFPDKWIGPFVLLENVRLTDSTILLRDNAVFLISHEENDSFFVNLYSLNLNSKSIKLIEKKNDDEKRGRGAGYCFYFDSKLIRPTQNCKQRYGGSLIFNSVEFLKPFMEYPIKEIDPKMIKILPDRRIKGIHTYSSSNQVEVIDVLLSKKTDWILHLYQSVKKCNK